MEPRDDPTPSPSWTWERFMAAHAERVTRVVTRVCRDRDEAGDVSAGVLERLRNRWPQLLEGYRPAAGGSFNTWLAVVARNAAVDELRSRHGRRGAADGPEFFPLRAEEEPRGSQEPLEEVAGRGARRALARVLAELTGDERALLRLYYLEGRDAESLRVLFGGQTRSQVYNRVHALLNKLNLAVQRAGLGPEDVEHLRRMPWDRLLGEEGG